MLRRLSHQRWLPSLAPGTAPSLVQWRAGSKNDTGTFLLGQCLTDGSSALPGVLGLYSLAERPELPSQTSPHCTGNFTKHSPKMLLVFSSWSWEPSSSLQRAAGWWGSPRHRMLLSENTPLCTCTGRDDIPTPNPMFYPSVVFLCLQQPIGAGTMQLWSESGFSPLLCRNLDFRPFLAIPQKSQHRCVWINKTQRAFLQFSAFFVS